MGLRCSIDPLTALDEAGKPVAMFGVVPVALLGGRGRVWFLATPECFRCARQLIEQGPRIIGVWLETFERLDNIVAVENGKAIRMLEHWGFTLGGGTEMHRGVEFIPFAIERAAIQASPVVA